MRPAEWFTFAGVFVLFIVFYWPSWFPKDRKREPWDEY